MKKLVVGAAVLCASLAFAPAGFAHANPSLATVLAHTHAADIALDRAVANFNAHALGAGRSELRRTAPRWARPWPSRRH